MVLVGLEKDTMVVWWVDIDYIMITGSSISCFTMCTSIHFTRDLFYPQLDFGSYLYYCSVH